MIIVWQRKLELYVAKLDKIIDMKKYFAKKTLKTQI